MRLLNREWQVSTRDSKFNGSRASVDTNDMLRHNQMGQRKKLCRQSRMAATEPRREELTAARIALPRGAKAFLVEFCIYDNESHGR